MTRTHQLNILGVAVHTVDHFADLPLWKYSMAFVYLKAYLRQFPEYDDVSFEMLNYYQNEETDKIAADIERIAPDVVLFSVYVWNFSIYRRLAREIKRSNPNIIVVLGGPEVSDETQLLLHQTPAFDVIVRGEGEHVFYELVKRFLAGGDLSDVAGITYRRGASVIENSDQGRLALMPLDVIPSVFVDEIFDWSSLKGSFVALETQRGCNFSCGFCRYRKMDGRGARFFSLERVYQELEFIKRRIEPKYLYLMDPTFNNRQDRAKTILRWIIDLGLNVEVNTEMVPEFMDEELLDLSIQAGVHNLEVGIQSIHKPVLNIMQRPRNHVKLVNMLELASQKEIDGKRLNVIPQIIYGLPGDTFEGYCQSFDFIYESNLEEIAAYHLLVLRDTQFFLDRERHGLVYDGEPPHKLLWNNTFPKEDLVLAAKLSCAALGTQYHLRKYIKAYCRSKQLTPSEFFLREVGVGDFEEALAHSFPVYAREHLDVQLKCLRKTGQVLLADNPDAAVRAAVEEAEAMLTARLDIIAQHPARSSDLQAERERLEAELLALEGLSRHGQIAS